MALAISALLFVPRMLEAQTTLSISGTPVRPGAQATISLTLSGSAGQNLAGLQWTVSLPAGYTPAIVAGAASTAAGKTITCNQTGATVICLAVGINTNVFADGVVANIQFVTQSAGNLNFALSGTMGATLVGDAAVVGAAAPFAYTVLSPCDINGDALTDVTDVTAIIQSVISGGACVADLNGDGKCTVVDVTRVINAALGQACKVGGGG